MIFTVVWFFMTVKLCTMSWCHQSAQMLFHDFVVCLDSMIFHESQVCKWSSLNPPVSRIAVPWFRYLVG
jgi:hypothetical protein